VGGMGLPWLHGTVLGRHGAASSATLFVVVSAAMLAVHLANRPAAALDNGGS
jgi:hypothetical protein